MLKWFIVFGAGYYLGMQSQKAQTNAALADRNSLLSFLSPQQQAAIQNAISAGKQAVTQASAAVSSASQSIPTSTTGPAGLAIPGPMQGLGNVTEFDFD